MSLITNNLDQSKEIEDFDIDDFDDEMTLGGQFSKLKESYVLFICTGDPFKCKLPVYTVKRIR